MKLFTVLGACCGCSSTVIVPLAVCIRARYFFFGSIAIGGGVGHCFIAIVVSSMTLCAAFIHSPPRSFTARGFASASAELAKQLTYPRQVKCPIAPSDKEVSSLFPR